MDPAVAPVGQPEWPDPGNLPLPAVRMAAQNEIGRVMLLEMIDHIRRVGQDHRKLAAIVPGQDAQVGPMERRIVQSHNPKLAIREWNARDLVDQKREFVPIGPLGELVDRDPAPVIMIAQRHECGRHLTQSGKEAKQVRQSFRHIEQIPGDEDPVRLQLGDGSHQDIVPGVIVIDVQVCQVNSPPAREGRVTAFDPVDLER